MQGYDAGDFSHDPAAVLPACCEDGSRGDGETSEATGADVDELEQLDDAANWENAKNLRELEALGRRGDDDSNINDSEILNEKEEDDGKLLDWVKPDPVEEAPKEDED